MSKVYWLKFGSGDPRPNTGMTPTFLQFYDCTGQTYVPPSIAEVKYGGVTASGMYGFSFSVGITTQNSLYFLAYAATTVSSGLSTDQYVTGVLDPLLISDQDITIVSTNLAALSSTVLAIGNTTLALSSSVGILSSYIGSTASSFGSSSTDPSTVFGYLKRLQELFEGDNVFTASSGQWLIYNRASLGTTTLLRTKTVSNPGSQVTKSGI